MNTNKYLEKIAATFAEIAKTEFDRAFEEGPNPTRERILGYGIGIGALGVGALNSDPILFAAGGLTTGLTALVHRMRDPKLQERRHPADTDNLVARKHELSESSQKLG